jgi:hypothetical protein
VKEADDNSAAYQRIRQNTRIDPELDFRVCGHGVVGHAGEHGNSTIVEKYFQRVARAALTSHR